MKHTFKKGDRVKKVDASFRYAGTVRHVYDQDNESSSVYVDWDNGFEEMVFTDDIELMRKPEIKPKRTQRTIFYLMCVASMSMSIYSIFWYVPIEREQTAYTAIIALLLAYIADKLREIAQK